jgi:hypothetical protein
MLKNSTYPDFWLEDELLEKGGGRDVMRGVQCTKCHDKRQAETGEAAPAQEIRDLE